MSNRLKILIAVFVIILVILAFNYQSLFPKPTTIVDDDPQVIALRQLEAASTTTTDLNFVNGFPTFVSGRIAVSGSNPGERATNFLKTYKDLYLQNNPDLELAVRRVGGVDNEDVVFYQTYKGIPVFSGELIVSLIGKEVFATVGNLLTEVDLDINPIIDANTAEQIAMAFIDQPEAVPVEKTSLVIFDQSFLDDTSPDPHLAWQITLANPVSMQFFIDAQNAEVLFDYSLRMDSLNLRFNDANYTDSTTCYFWSPDDHTIGTVSGLDPAYSSDPDATLGYTSAIGAYNFYWDTFGRDSYNGSGGPVKVFIHTTVANASWFGWDCNMIQFADGWVSWDVMVHEFTHGVIQHTSRLNYVWQSGALNEGYSDVMASIADSDDWTVAEDRTSGMGAIRDMSNPPAFRQPDRMSAFVSLPSSSDNGGVHTNSGILNKAAYLIAAGDTFNGWSIRGIGRGKLGDLFYSVMISLPSNANYMTARNATVARADMWASTGRFTLSDACQVQNAFAAVELGVGDLDCDGIDDPDDLDVDGDYIPDSRDNCPEIPNPRQEDMDGDGIGDVCDPDIDGDGFNNDNDNCPLVTNPDQVDSDGNGTGDVCQDTDGDGVIDIEDNCFRQANRGQEDFDGDGTGDVCDIDMDGDTVFNPEDNCPLYYNPFQRDLDGDGIGDGCDNCRDESNPGQEDIDDDDIGDVCDNDIDGDGVPNDEDSCPRDYDPDGFDLDGNGLGLACDENEATMLDGIEIPAMIQGFPGDISRFPFDLCLADCPDYFDSTFVVSISLTDLDPNVSVWVTDNYGRMITSPNLDNSVHLMSFTPLGGFQYFLNFAFGPDYPEGGEENFGMSMSSSYGDQQQAEPTQEDPNAGTPTPTPEPDSTPPTATGIRNATCREGGPVDYPEVDFLLEDQSAPIVGISEDGNYYRITGPTWDIDCWVWRDLVETEGDLSRLPVIPYPPLPPTPTLTPVPEKPTPKPSLTPCNQKCP